MDYLIGHLAGDYLLQNDWMAANKRQSTRVCLAHVSLYCMAVALLTGWPWWALALTAVCHFTQDRTPIVRWYMQRVGQAQFAAGPMAPWSVVVVDNSLHLLQLHLTQRLVEWLQHV